MSVQPRPGRRTVAVTVAVVVVLVVAAVAAVLLTRGGTGGAPTSGAPTSSARPTQSAPTSTPGGGSAGSDAFLVGAKVTGQSYAEVEQAIGPIRVTRVFYPNALPATFTRAGVPQGVKIIVSYKTPDTNVASYVRSIPAGADVEIAFHHEPENDYPSGADFVAEFDRQADLIHATDPRRTVAFIAGAFNYAPGRPGADGSYIPTKQDRSYLDTYQRGIAQMVPAAQDPNIQAYLALLKQRGLHFDGFTEYGRGLEGAAQDPDVNAKRAQLIATDAAWLRSIGARVLCYWYVNRGDGSFRFTDAASQQAWRQVSSAAG